MSDDLVKPKRKLRFPILPTPQLEPTHPGGFRLIGRLFLEGTHPSGLIALRQLGLDASTREGSNNVNRIETEPVHPFFISPKNLRALEPVHPSATVFSKEYVLPEAATVKRIRVETDSQGNHFLTLEDE